MTVALVGSAVACSTGTISANNGGTVALIGSAVSCSTGSPVPTYSRAPTGSEVTAAAGTLAVNLRPTNVTGQLVTVGQGFATPEGNNVTVNVTGEESTFAVGDLTGGTTFLSGIAVTAAQTVPSLDLSMPLTGLGLAISAGQLAPNQDAVDVYIVSGLGVPLPESSQALTGSSIGTAQGAMTVTGDASIPLTGEAVTAATGSFEYGEEYALGGQSFTAQQHPVGAPGGAELSGAEVTASAGTIYLDNDRSYPITGQSVSVLDGQAVTSYLAFPLGEALTVSIQDIGPREIVLAGAQIDASTGLVAPPVADVGVSGGYWPEYGPRKKKRKPEEEEVAEVAAPVAPPKRPVLTLKPKAPRPAPAPAPKPVTVAEQLDRLAVERAKAAKKRRREMEEKLLMGD